VLSLFVMILTGSAFVIADLMRARSLGRKLLHTAATAALAFVLIAGGFGISNIVARSADNLGHSPSGWAAIRFPADTTSFPDPASIKAEMRTPLGRDRAVPNDWRDEQGRKLLAVSLRFQKYTRDRELVVTMPDGLTLIFKPPFPANPKISFGYGAWYPIDGFLGPDGTFRPATAKDDYAIRYMITR
jgi:hypothetical protein